MNRHLLQNLYIQLVEIFENMFDETETSLCIFDLDIRIDFLVPNTVLNSSFLF